MTFFFFFLHCIYICGETALKRSTKQGCSRTVSRENGALLHRQKKQQPKNKEEEQTKSLNALGMNL